MPARRKIPLVWKGQKESEQRLFKYNPGTQRVVRVGCDCPPQPSSEPIFTAISSVPGNPGSGNLLVELISFPTVEIRISNLNINSINVSSFLAAMASATTITISKSGDPSAFGTFSKNSATNNIDYWSYGATATGSSGMIVPGDYIIISYA